MTDQTEPQPQDVETGGAEETAKLTTIMGGTCSCGSVRLFPVAGVDTPPVIAITCDDCGEIEGDAPDLKQAVTNWNKLRR